MEDVYSDKSTNNADNDDNNSIVQENYDDMVMDPGEVTLPNRYQNQDKDDTTQEFIPSTNQRELLFEVIEESPEQCYVNGHVILNQCGSICSSSSHHIKSYQSQRHFIQQIVSTSAGDFIPLIYPISMLFPSIRYKMIPNCGSIAGIVPSSLMVTNTSINGFALFVHHI